MGGVPIGGAVVDFFVCGFGGDIEADDSLVSFFGFVVLDDVVWCVFVGSVVAFVCGEVEAIDALISEFLDEVLHVGRFDTLDIGEALDSGVFFIELCGVDKSAPFISAYIIACLDESAREDEGFFVAFEVLDELLVFDGGVFFRFADVLLVCGIDV